MKSDIDVKVFGTLCCFAFRSPDAEQFGIDFFDNARHADVPIGRARNVLLAIKAAGLTVTPGVLFEIDRQLAFIGLTQPGSAMDEGDEMPIDRFGCRLATEAERSTRAERKVLEWLMVILVSVMIAVRIWVIAEPLVRDIRQVIS